MIVDIFFESKLVASYTINIGMLTGGEPLRSDFIKEAVRCAKEDDLLTDEKLEKATFELRR
ncbi:hypothetical protein GCM10011273_15510 [Asticcacaulis endophyticus]|uniref:Uncharacterized protein n=1 Tax=Asticcacaulis endophyticus TaxID=1395890 RepID=A0A918USF1_9CAUL|nr:hypothetical protein GCM10011273_15510 [Asticcacaulis endophyticus]